MLEHCQVLTPVELDGELGRQLMQARGGFEQVQNLPGQWLGVVQHARIEPGQRAEHQVAHIVASGITRAQACRQQVLDQPCVISADAADLQVGTVGCLDHAPA